MAIKPSTAYDDLQQLRAERTLLMDEIRQLIDETREQMSTLSALLAEAQWAVARQSWEQ